MLTGTVTRVEWINPHARFYVDVKNADGNVTNWECELGSPNTPDAQRVESKLAEAG